MDATGIKYMKPLSMNDRLLIDTVTARYEGVPTPFVVFEREDHFELRCAPTIRMTPERLETLKRQANEAKIAAQEVCGTAGLSNA